MLRVSMRSTVVPPAAFANTAEGRHVSAEAIASVTWVRWVIIWAVPLVADARTIF
jgi:hypothetical protein